MKWSHHDMKRTILSAAAMVVLVPSSPAATAIPAGAEAREVSFASLVQAMTNREALARFPLPRFRLRDQSSRDRLSSSPDDPKTWFANRDAGNFIRVEEHAGRKEWVHKVAVFAAASCHWKAARCWIDEARGTAEPGGFEWMGCIAFCSCKLQC